MPAPGFIYRRRGPVLTYGSLHEFGDCLYRGEYDAKKVVAVWGPPAGGWTDADRDRILWEFPGQTIVRTLTGDGEADWAGQGYPTNATTDEEIKSGKLYPTPDAAEAEIAPWYRRRQDIWVEIGNEPNTYNRWYKAFNEGTEAQKTTADRFVWFWQWYFGQTVDRLRQKFPKIKIISPGLQRWGAAKWYEICQSQFARADVSMVGFHQFGDYNFFGSNSWHTEVIDQLNYRFPTKDLFCTEYGLNHLGTSDGDKGRRYAELVHFGRSERPWPTRVIGATYFHFDSRPPGGGAIQPQYHIYDGGGDFAYRDRVNIG